MAKGWDTFKAWVRQGANDLHNNIVPAFPAHAAGINEPGIPGTLQADMGAGSTLSFEERIAASVPQAPPGAEPETDMDFDIEP